MKYLQVIIVVCLFNTPATFVLDDGGQSDIQYLHQLLAEEKQQRLVLEHRVNAIEETECGCAKDISVSFMAQLSATLNNPANGRVIVFDDVVTNVGSAYSNVHGIFTAPVNGTYYFNLVASSPPATIANHGMHLHIVKDKQQVAYIFLDYNTAYWFRRTTSSLLHLTQGSEIWVDVSTVIGEHALGGCCFHTHFQGFLVQAD